MRITTEKIDTGFGILLDWLPLDPRDFLGDMEYRVLTREQAVKLRDYLVSKLEVPDGQAQ